MPAAPLPAREAKRGGDKKEKEKDSEEKKDEKKIVASHGNMSILEEPKVLPKRQAPKLTDEMKENWKDYVGKVCEISCMEIMTNQDGSKGLRHPKLICFRNDKTKEECLWEDVFK